MFREHIRFWRLEQPDQGAPQVVKFRLVFRGKVPPEKRGTAEAKHAIRKQLHPQLRTLWYQHPALKPATVPQQYPKPGPPYIAKTADDYKRCGFRFVPLVAGSLVCVLEVLVLRRDEPYQIFAAGDLDNLLKTLIDGLKMPQQCSELAGQLPETDEDPFFCLLEDDRNVIEFRALTDKLLVPPEPSEPLRDVLAIINVKVTSHGGGEFFMTSDESSILDADPES